jgi:hypothetical protein
MKAKGAAKKGARTLTPPATTGPATPKRPRPSAPDVRVPIAPNRTPLAPLTPLVFRPRSAAVHPDRGAVIATPSPEGDHA